VPAFRVKLGANDLNCVNVPLNPTQSFTRLPADVLMSLGEVFECIAETGSIWTKVTNVWRVRKD